MKQQPQVDAELKKALDVLRTGGTLLYPTDTVWGLGCDATNAAAIDKIFKLKKREESKSLIVLVCDENMLNRYVKEVPAIAWDLISCSDKPLTIVYPGAQGIAKNAIAEDGSIGIRLTRDDFCRDLIHKFGKPLVSTSANVSGEPAPAAFREISPVILNNADYTVNLRRHENTGAAPSSIIKLFPDGAFKIIRK